MSDDFPDLSQDEFATMYTNGNVTVSVNGQRIPLTVNSETIALTDAQAELICHCLSLLDTDLYMTAETARRTREQLQSRFDLSGDDSFFEFSGIEE